MERGEALITGASSGIGEAFARRLAAQGMRIILTARREEKLRRLARELPSAEVLIADLTDPAALKEVARRATTGPLEILINNAGFGLAGNLADTEAAKIDRMNDLHVRAPAVLCRAVLPGMIARRRGAVINVASIAGFLPMPGRANYAATKAYLIALSRALHGEAAPAGVRVQALCPGFTYTEFHDSPEFVRFDRSQVPALFWMTAEAVVEESLRGLEKGKALVVPGFWNRFLVASFKNPLSSRFMKSAYGRCKAKKEAAQNPPAEGR